MAITDYIYLFIEVFKKTTKGVRERFDIVCQVVCDKNVY